MGTRVIKRKWLAQVHVRYFVGHSLTVWERMSGTREREKQIIKRLNNCLDLQLFILALLSLIPIPPDHNSKRFLCFMCDYLLSFTGKNTGKKRIKQFILMLLLGFFLLRYCVLCVSVCPSGCLRCYVSFHSGRSGPRQRASPFSHAVNWRFSEGVYHIYIFI